MVSPVLFGVSGVVWVTWGWVGLSGLLGFGIGMLLWGIVTILLKRGYRTK